MYYDALKTFVTVVEEKNFTKSDSEATDFSTECQSSH